MAAPFYSLATQIVIDGPRNTVTKTTGDIIAEVTPVVIVTASALTNMWPALSGATPPSKLRLDCLDYSITDGLIVTLLWEATTPLPIMELYGRGKIDANCYGGLWNNAGAGVTGNIMIQVESSGAAFPTDGSLTIIMQLVKNRAGGA